MCASGKFNRLSLAGAARFGLGFGIGGCYPLSAAKSAEGARGADGAAASIGQKNFEVGLNLLFQVVVFWGLSQ